MKKIIAIAAVLVLHRGGYTQPLTGRVTDSAHAPLPDVIVTLIRLPQLNIVHYSITQKDGSYRLTAAGDDTASLLLRVQLFGYGVQTIPFQPGRTRYDFTLFPEASTLPEAVVQSSRPRIRSNGDTSTYTAADFAHAQDRTIGDVLRRMPGIDVDNTGKIYYNGKAVSAFYIDGDNLLDDRYNIGTTSIPHIIVDKVQVIENNEPIKVKAGHTAGNETVINITLKSQAQHPINQLSLAAGPPDYYDITLNNLLFRSRYKALNQFKANNTGVGYENDLTDYNRDAANARTGDPLPEPFVSLTGLSRPPIESRRYLFNNSGILNTNNLFHLQNDWQLKLKASWLYDRQQQHISNSTSILLNNSSISYSDNSQTTVRPEKINAELSLTANKNKLYFSDKVRGQTDRDQEQGTLLSNSLASTQHLDTRLTQFANECHLISQLNGNRLAEIYSYTSTWRFPQTLGISPDSFAALTQQISLPTFYTNNYAALSLPGALTQTYKAGASYQSQQLNTRLTGQPPGGSQTLAADSAGNNLSWKRYRLYAEAQLDYINRDQSQKATLRLPLSWISTRITNTPLEENRTILHIYFEPELTLQLSPRGQSAIRLRAALNNDPGSILNFYSGYILKDYRTLQANNTGFHTSQQQYELGYTLRQSARLLFFNSSIKYSVLSSNTIPNARVTDSLTIINTLIPNIKTANSFEFNTGISKYFFRWSSTVSANYQYKYARTNQVFNGSLLPFNNYSQFFAFRVSSKLQNDFDLSYAGILTRLSGQPSNNNGGENPAATATTLNQKLQLAWLPGPLVTLKAGLEDLYNPITGATNQNSLFIDAAIQYKINAIHTDLELSATNLANSSIYRVTQLTTNSVATTSYPLRPRIILLRAAFNL